MARNRKPRASSNTDSTSSTSNTTNSNSNERLNKMALTPDQIQALLGSTRTKGDYVVKLNEFLESGEAGVCVNETWVEMKDKKAPTLKQGFEAAKEKKDAAEGAEAIKVIANDGKVYLLNLKAAGIEVPEEVAV